MKIYFEKLNANLSKELTTIKHENLPFLKECEKSVSVISQSMHKLRQFIFQNSFAHESDEIHFFKVVKPSIYSQLIYHVDRYNIESGLPIWSSSESKNYIECHINRINNFRQKNRELYQYLRNDLTSFDDRYFRRYRLNLCNGLDAFTFDADPNFTTDMDYKVARFKADELLLDDLNEKLFALTEDEAMPPCSIQYIRWTKSKIALTELIYALHAAGCFNNGVIDIKIVARYFQKAFNVQLGDFYRDFYQIKNRFQATKFIDHLKSTICDKINGSDN